ncbi:uncharacterized protein LOC111632001 [Centruroides sculpturatus]|uniref:uncharacterized protein LOC111632001 n=1 Tax=Centruroides sculpturatus TaxID=218467 RepID=UPI000C6D9237|nr:uncharacterized protein LOC111632001 [Centruroides sculpturatus]
MLTNDGLTSNCISTMNQQKCRFYSNGFCRYSDKCKYSHDFEVQTENISLNNVNNSYWRRRGRVQNFQRKPPRFQRVKGENEKPEERKYENFQEVSECLQDSRASVDRMKPVTVRHSARYFYKRLPRWRNMRGRFHRRPLERQDVSENDYISVDEKSDDVEKAEEAKAKDENESNLEKLRETEIKQFQKRFPKYGEVSKDIFRFEYFPTDPDWPFEVKSVNLQVEFPKEYPDVPFLITVVDEDEILPDMLIRHINRTVRNWILDKWEKNNDRVCLAFRPFLRWFDKNLEELFICGLRWTKQDIETKAAGIEFVPYEMLCNSKLESASSESDSNNDDDVSCKDSYEMEQNVEKSEDITDENKDIINTTRQLSINDSPRPNKNNYSGLKTEIKFKDLHFADHAATLTCQKLQIVILCNRCKSRHDLTMLGHRLNLATCTKCQQTQELIFQPSLLHPNSSILGYVHIQHCQIIDLPLVACEFSISCLNCSRQNTLTGIHYNQQRTTWCLYCNSKMNVTIQGVRFLQLQTQEIVEKLQAHSVKLNSKFIKNQILPVQIGKPLPDNGTCKHYKKSFRWLRFPCCGKAYPCDVCHDEKEIDHEMKLATRMICGFCAREQPYTNKECIGCNSYVTKKSSIHWEGGKGCRDKIRMSRSDKHKYAGTNKTKSVKKVSANIST